MPIIKFHIGDAHGDPQAIERLLHTVQQACVGLLRAQPDAVQIILLPGCRLLYGPACYVEVLYRGQAHRDAPVMERFMALLEAQVLEVWDVRPRIRCMAFHQPDLHARN